MCWLRRVASSILAKHIVAAAAEQVARSKSNSLSASMQRLVLLSEARTNLAHDQSVAPDPEQTRRLGGGDPDAHLRCCKPANSAEDDCHERSHGGSHCGNTSKAFRRRSESESCEGNTMVGPSRVKCRMAFMVARARSTLVWLPAISLRSNCPWL
jgi:hypothetical protein